MFLLVSIYSKAKAEQNTYPPYPDVWQWELNIPKTATFIRSHRLENGDVLISYYYGAHGRKEVQKQFTLFGQQVVTRRNSGIELSDGSRLKIDQEIRWGTPVSYPDNSEIAGGTETNGPCWRGPANNYFVKRNGEGRPAIWTKSIFMILDKPEHFSVMGPPGACPEGSYPDLVRQVEAFDYGILPLRDGTFLVGFRGHLYIRLDKDFHTKAPLLNKKIFILDVDDNLVPPAANPTNFDYTNGSMGNSFSYQKALDDLYQYLVNLQKGDK